MAAAYTPLVAAAPLSEVSQVEPWTLDGVGTSDAVSVRLFWENAFRSDTDDFSTDLQVANFNGSTWLTAGNSDLGGNLNAGSVVSAQTTKTFGPFTLGSLSAAVNPLTSQMTTFSANQPRPNVVNLEWTLPNETNTYGYAVERSANASSWLQIGFVASQGLSVQTRLYTYQNPATGALPQAFYRLRQTTASGAARYSAVASVLLSSGLLAHYARQRKSV